MKVAHPESALLAQRAIWIRAFCGLRSAEGVYDRHDHPFDAAPRLFLDIDQPVLTQYVSLALDHGISQTQMLRSTAMALSAISVVMRRMATSEGAMLC